MCSEERRLPRVQVSAPRVVCGLRMTPGPWHPLSPRVHAATSLPPCCQTSWNCLWSVFQSGGRGFRGKPAVKRKGKFSTNPKAERGNFKILTNPKANAANAVFPDKQFAKPESWPTPSGSSEEGELLALDPSAFEDEVELKIPPKGLLVSANIGISTHTPINPQNQGHGELVDGLGWGCPRL